MWLIYVTGDFAQMGLCSGFKGTTKPFFLKTRLPSFGSRNHTVDFQIFVQALGPIVRAHLLCGCVSGRSYRRSLACTNF